MVLIRYKTLREKNKNLRLKPFSALIKFYSFNKARRQADTTYKLVFNLFKYKWGMRTRYTRRTWGYKFNENFGLKFIKPRLGKRYRFKHFKKTDSVIYPVLDAFGFGVSYISKVRSWVGRMHTNSLSRVGYSHNYYENDVRFKNFFFNASLTHFPYSTTMHPSFGIKHNFDLSLSFDDKEGPGELMMLYDGNFIISTESDLLSIYNSPYISEALMPYIVTIYKINILLSLQITFTNTYVIKIY